MRWLLFLLLTGCQTLEPRIITIKEPIEIKVAVPVPCISAVPPEPALMTEAEIVALDDYRAVQALRRQVLVLQVHVAELRALLATCAATPGV